MSGQIISPSILSADFGNLQRDIEMLDRSEAQWIHCDVMDGSFVPNISFGFPILKAVRKSTSKVMDVHLMIQNPDQYIAELAAIPVEVATVHQEACTHLDRTLNLIRSHGMKAGVSLNPGTPVEVLEDVLHLCDLVLVMSVNPGFGGQKFIENTYNKLIRLRKMCDRQRVSPHIQVDGGVNGDNMSKLLEAGANNLVAGSYIFKSENPEKTIAEMVKR